ncbi:MAG: response regulator transcription factor [Proteobacteria bacterium]|nr:response regulator transcription factor [Pseudomonadota bacterium]
MKSEIIINILDDDPNYSKTIKELLVRHYCNVDCYLDSISLLRNLQCDKQNIVLLDYHLEFETGDDVFELLSNLDKVSVIVVTGNNTAEIAVRLLKKGVNDYLIKPISQMKLLHAIDSVARNCKSKIEADTCNMSQLTLQQKKLLSFIVQGLTSKQIAMKMNLSISTVNNHKQTLFSKYECSNILELLNRVNLIKQIG